MSQVTSVVNTPFSIPFLASPGTTSFPDLKILKDGDLVSSPTFTVVEVSPGIFKFTYTPLATGVHYLFVGGAIVGDANIVDRTLASYLKNIEDESLGSWTWDKTAGTLVMYRQNGTSLGNFTVTETLTSASRARV